MTTQSAATTADRIAAVTDLAALFTNVVDAYRTWQTGPATVRAAGNAVAVAMHHLEAADSVTGVSADAYLAATAVGRRVARIAEAIHAGEVAGSPDRNPHVVA